MTKLQHCSGCTEKSWDSPEGRTHQEGTIEHPKIKMLKPKPNKKIEKIEPAIYDAWDNEELRNGILETMFKLNEIIDKLNDKR